MSRDDGFKEYILNDVLAHLGNIRARAMFGGYGIYWHDAFVALIAEGELYTKANADLKAKYSALGCHPFSYAKGDGKITEMNYMSVDESSLEDPRTIKIRFEEALDLALQAPVKPARKTNNKAKAEINNAK
jgi:DNA transformation protein